MKKAQKGAVAALVIIILSTVGILLVTSGVLDQASIESKELACRLSIMERAYLKLPGGISIGDLRCETFDRKVGTEDATSKDEVMKDIGDLSVRCWKMFGEGTLKTLRGTEDGLFAGLGREWKSVDRTYEKAFCFICYDVFIESIDDDETITEGNLIGLYSQEVYLADEKAVESSCNNNEDDDGDGNIDCQPGNEDSECICEEGEKARLKENPCEQYGGKCKASCSGFERKVAKSGWECIDSGDICCIDETDVYTYQDYIESHSGMGGTIVFVPPEDGPFTMQEGERYGIAYVEPAGGDRKKASFLAVGNFDDLNGMCLTK
ncbi:MAG: hypothetical protein ACOC32_04280 [Nanoarchaeota archaeon]